MPKKTKNSKKSKSGGKSSNKGLSVETFTGLSKKRMAQGGGFGNRLPMKKGRTIPVVFLDTPKEMREAKQHVWQEGGQWHFVPHLNSDCLLCESDNEKQRGTSYMFVANVFNVEEGKVQVLSGPRDLARRVMKRYEQAPSKFLKRVYDVTMFDSSPATYEVERSEEDLPKKSVMANAKKLSLKEYLDGEAERYYGEAMPDASALDDDDDDDYDYDEDDDDDEDEAYSKADLKAMERRELVGVAKRLGVKKTKGVNDTVLIKKILAKQDD